MPSGVAFKIFPADEQKLGQASLNISQQLKSKHILMTKLTIRPISRVELERLSDEGRIAKIKKTGSLAEAKEKHLVALRKSGKIKTLRYDTLPGVEKALSGFFGAHFPVAIKFDTSEQKSRIEELVREYEENNLPSGTALDIYFFGPYFYYVGELR